MPRAQRKDIRRSALDLIRYTPGTYTSAGIVAPLLPPTAALAASSCPKDNTMTSTATVIPATSASDKGTYAYIAVFSAVLYTVLLIAPVIAGKLVEQFGLTPVQVTAALGLVSS